ncbi:MULTISPECIES: DUF2507 domain-containing protein [unclassified Jeotgalibaca]|uniref:DUF2507 domain-containing protein n=1 Tax=unclassified Jeotgalibaca TaxID=2621505 RepID=UPI003FCFC1BC
MSSKNRDALIDSTHFPYILIRDFLLSNILGDDRDEILYWSGKELARQFLLTEKEDITESFSHCGFGELAVLKKDKNKQTFQLMGDLIETRLLNPAASFQLEAGFLAEQMTHLSGYSCETKVEIMDGKTVNLIVIRD